MKEKTVNTSVSESILGSMSSKNPYRMLKSSTFVDFVKIYEERIANTIFRIVRSIPTSMNDMDYRSLLSDMYARTFDREFYQLKDRKSVGFDMVYNNSVNISVKTFQTEVFQRPKLSGKGLTKPKEIMLKNFLSKGKGFMDKTDYFDYILLISAYYDNRTREYVIKFGTTSFESVKEMKPYVHKGQMRVLIPNKNWFFISKTYRVEYAKAGEVEERKNNVLNTGLDNIYFELQRVS